MPTIRMPAEASTGRSRLSGREPCARRAGGLAGAHPARAPRLARASRSRGRTPSTRPFMFRRARHERVGLFRFRRAQYERIARHEMALPVRPEPRTGESVEGTNALNPAVHVSTRSTRTGWVVSGFDELNTNGSLGTKWLCPFALSLARASRSKGRTRSTRPFMFRRARHERVGLFQVSTSSIRTDRSGRTALPVRPEPRAGESVEGTNALNTAVHVSTRSTRTGWVVSGFDELNTNGLLGTKWLCPFALSLARASRSKGRTRSTRPFMFRRARHERVGLFQVSTSSIRTDCSARNGFARSP
jgi:hypothetical protein